MKDFFTAKTDPWDDPSGQLHAYLLPGKDFIDWAIPILNRLGGCANLAVQPEEALHVTVQRIPHMRGDLSDHQIRHLLDATAHAVSSLKPWTMDFSSPEVTCDSVLCFGEPVDKFHIVADAVRGAACDVLGSHACHYSAPPRPHITLAYAHGDADDAEAMKAVGDILPPPVNCEQVVWCAVHQNIDQGIYTFDVIGRIPVGLSA